MLGNIGELGPVIKALMSGDKKAMVELARPYLPQVITVVVGAVVEAGGGDPTKDGAYLWLYVKADGELTVMATIYRRTVLDEPGETIGRIDVLDLLATTELAQYLK